MAGSPRLGMLAVALLAVVFTTWFLLGPAVEAQSGKSKIKPKPATAGEVRQIDVRLEKLQETFESESTAIIEGYERTGHYERAKSLLEVLHKLDPKNDSFKKRIAEMDERILERTEFERRFDTSGDWTFVGIVNKDRPARIEASGDFRVEIPTVSLGPAGYPGEDVRRDLLSAIPTGALMGMVVTEAGLKEKKPLEPFTIKAKYEFTPKQDGELYLKINLPPGSRSTGELKLKLCGIVRAT